MTDGAGDRYLAVGVVLKPHGVKGEVKVRPETDDPARFRALRTVRCRLPGGGERDLTVASVRLAGETVLVRFAEFDAPETVAVLRGGTLLVPRTEAAPLAEGRVYLADVVGLPVVDAHGVSRGTVQDVVVAAGQELLAIATPAGERLVPWVDALVAVDVAAGRVVVQAIPGLLDDEGAEEA